MAPGEAMADPHGDRWGRVGCCGKKSPRTNRHLALVVGALFSLTDSIWNGTILVRFRPLQAPTLPPSPQSWITRAEVKHCAQVTFLFIITGTNADVGLLQGISGLVSLGAALPVGYAADVLPRSRVIAWGGSLLLFSLGATLIYHSAACGQPVSSPYV